ncbi:hypothetical protein vseg_006188 [Gypsophila vaccaria]
MRQRRWLEFISDYMIELRCHEGKANVVADALSRKLCYVMNRGIVVPNDISREFEKFSLKVVLPGTIDLNVMVSEPKIFHEIQVMQREDDLFEKVRTASREGQAEGFEVGSDGRLMF